MTSPFLPNYRDFPVDDEHNLQKQLVNFHNQTNTAVNQRTIGTFQSHVVGVNDAIPNGERWYPATGQQRLRDAFRLVVQVSDSNLVVNHNIPLINFVTRLYGTFTDPAGEWRTLPYVDFNTALNQITLNVTPTQIRVQKGPGTPSIFIFSGIVVMEFI